MQAIAIGLLLNLFVMQSPAGARKTDRERNGLSGDVRSILIEIATFSKDMVEGKRFNPTVIRYDAQGRLIEWGQYNDNRIIARNIYSYDSEGNITKKQYLAQRANSTAAPSAPVPNIIQCAVKYDSEGNLTEETCKGADAKVISKTEYKLEKAKHRAAMINYEAGDKISSRCVATLGAHGEPVEEDCQRYGNPAIAGRVRRTYTYEFDNAGNWVKR